MMARILTGAACGALLLYGLAAFVTWDPSWLSGIAGWDRSDRVFFLYMLTIFVVVGGFIAWETRRKQAAAAEPERAP